MKSKEDSSNDVLVKTYNPNHEPWKTDIEALAEGLAIQNGIARMNNKDLERTILL